MTTETTPSTDSLEELNDSRTPLEILFLKQKEKELERAFTELLKKPLGHRCKNLQQKIYEYQEAWIDAQGI